MGGEPARASQEIVERVAAAATIEACIEAIVEELDVTHVAYHMGYKDAEGFEQPFIRTNYPMEWLGRYITMNYLAVDPVARAGFQCDAPVCWSELDWSPEPVQAFRADASAYGVPMNGLMVPVIDSRQRRSLANFSADMEIERWRDFIREHQCTIVECAGIIHSKAVAELFKNGEPEPSLSPRELQCLILAAKGYDAGSMAGKLELSEHTVRDYCKSAREKLGCNNIAQAVHKATILRLIDSKFS